MLAFQSNLNQLNQIIELKVMVKIPSSAQNRIQLRIGFWITPGFFYLWSTSSGFRSPSLAEFEIP